MAIKGFNFRATDTFVTDGANETYVLGEAYPVTRNGITFGLDLIADINTRNRNAGNDRRLAGVNWNSAVDVTFRVDLLTSGTHEIRVAAGDASYSQATIYFELKDDTTIFATVDDLNGVAANSFDDATGVERTQAAWPGSNLAVSRVFASTIFRILMDVGDPIAHVQVEDIPAAGRGRSIMVVKNRVDLAWLE